MSFAGASPGARLRVGVPILAVVTLMLFGPAASAKPRPQPQPSPVGYDVSYPQCGKALPAAAFGIVGVNAGVVFSANPCLGVGSGPSELAWAQQAANHAPAFYANTGNPGPAYSSHWPTGQTSPQLCDAAAPNAPSCSYDYGWNAAADSFHDAVVAEQQVNGTTDTVAAAAAAGAVWWLDVETGNSWQTLESAYGQTAAAKANDVAALDGAVAYLRSVGVATVGFYSTSYQWTQITGGTGTHFASTPSWVAGFSSASAAQSGCTSKGFTGGPVKLTQYHANGLDADVACA
jgi:hypothetical protein